MIRRIAAAQLQVDIAARHRLQSTGVQYRGRQTGQLAGFVETQQRQQARIFNLTRVSAVNTGYVAPDGDARHPRQGTDLCCGVVRAVTSQQHGFTRVAAADKAGYDDTFVRMLHQQLLEQRIREAFINLRLSATLGTQEITRVQPCRFQTLLLQDGRHQAGRPDFAVAHDFSINGVSNAAVE